MSEAPVTTLDARPRGDDAAPRAASFSPGAAAVLALAPSVPRRGESSGVPFDVVDLGRTDYLACWRAMQAFTDARTDATPDALWLTEHASVYTLGLAGRREHLLRDNAIPVHKVDRGGQVTYHGPGQLVVYVLVDLKRRRLGVRTLVRALEGAVVDWLAERGIAARGRADAPGVYVDRGAREAKIAALGLKVRKGCTYHGVAVNLDVDLAPFRDIDPCGYPGLAVTRLADLGASPDLRSAGRALAGHIVRRIDGASA